MESEESELFSYNSSESEESYNFDNFSENEESYNFDNSPEYEESWEQGESPFEMSYLKSYLSMVRSDLPCAGPHPPLATWLAGACVLACLLFCVHYLRQRGDLLGDLSLEHARGGALQVCCVALLYNTEHGATATATATYQLLTFITLLTPFWTLCVALLIFSNLFMFKNRDIYRVGQVARFALIFTLAVHLCEELFGFALAVLITIIDDPFGPILASIRFTSVLLVMCVPVAVLGVSVLRAALTRSVLLLLLHLIVLVASDVLYGVYKLTDYRDPRKPPYVFVLFCVKPILEMFWYILVKRCMLRYLSKEDLYLP